MKKILIVDDSPFIRLVIKDIVGRIVPDSQVIEADTGTTALKQFHKTVPDLILLDIVMPEGENEGINVLKQIMAVSPQIKVVMVTAVGQNVMIDRCKKLGIKDYITKPFDDEQIEQVIKKYIE